MGEAKRRKQLDPNWAKPVQVKIEQSELSGKWLCVAYILSQRTIISPHWKKEDAEAAAVQVEEKFNETSSSEWRRYVKDGDRTPLSKAIALLDYEDDDEVLGVAQIHPDGSVVVDSDLETRRKVTEYANQRRHDHDGKSLFVEPQMYPSQVAK